EAAPGKTQPQASAAAWGKLCPDARHRAVTFTRPLASYITCIQAAREGRVGGAFDDGATIGKQRHLVGVVPEFQDEVVVTDCAVGLEATVQLGEVNGPLALMDLHGIPAAQGDVRAAFAGQLDEIALTARATTGAGLGGGDFGVLVRPDVEGKEGAPQLWCGRAGEQEFERLGRGDGGYQIHRRIEDAGSFAGFDHAARRVGKQTSPACGLAGQNVQGDGIASDGGGIDPGKCAVDGIVIDQVTSFEVVGAVEDQR